MNKPEVGKLLLLASGFDRRIVDDLTVSSWFSVPAIQQANFEDAAAAVIAHQTGPNKDKYLTVGLVCDYITGVNRQSADAIAADVRSARARGLVAKNWDERDPIPEEARTRLAALRDESRQYANVYGEIEVGRNVDFGEVGRRV
jgi:hypothetical protein